jgi:hypothetical protein
MKRPADTTLAIKKFLPGLVKAASFALAACCVAISQTSLQVRLPQIQLPEVHLDAAGLAPRSIEALTGTTIARHYALAWRDLAEALESGRAEGLGEEFVGFEKDRLLQRIAEQKQAGVHVHVVDHGHHLKAVFYSSDGTAMQLLDQAQLEIQTFDGNQLLDTQNAPHEYMVLMTPGADRWYVRDLEEVSAKSF